VLNNARNWWYVRDERGRVGFVPKTHLATEFGSLVTDIIPNGTVIDDNVDYAKGELPVVGQSPTRAPDAR
jgi:hypothetical protein